MLSVGMEYERTPDPSWQAALDAIAPRSATLSWLLLRWEPGDPWQPIHRWAVYQMYPEGVIPERVQEGLAGPHPRSRGHYCAVGWCRCRGSVRNGVKPNRWVDGPETAVGLSRQSWELYRQTGCYGRRWWIIQGPHGGHRADWTQIESKVARIRGLGTQPPAIGDLPYAEFNTRTFWSIYYWDRLRTWTRRYQQEFTRRGDAVFDREERDARESAQRMLGDWLERQIHGTTAEFRSALRKASEIPRPRDYEMSRVDEEQAEQAFITAA